MTRTKENGFIAPLKPCAVDVMALVANDHYVTCCTYRWQGTERQRLHLLVACLLFPVTRLKTVYRVLKSDISSENKWNSRELPPSEIPQTWNGGN